MMRRFVSIWCPSWFLDQGRLQQRGFSAPPDGAFALVEPQAHGPRLVAVSSAAQAAGVRAGQRLSDARAIYPKLAVAPLDRAAASAALDHLCLWLQRYTPWVTPEPEDGALLDITGAAHLLGGEANLCSDLMQRLRKSGIAVRLAVADTPLAAWGLARFGKMDLILQQGELRAALGPLPVAALNLQGETVDMLRRLGLKRVGDLLPIPRAALARRFRSKAAAQDVLLRLDQAFATQADPRVPAVRPQVYRRSVQLIEPILEAAQIAAWFAQLLPPLLAELEAAQVGVRRLALLCFGLDGSVQNISIGCARASRDAAHLIRLMRPKFETITPGFGLEALLLCAQDVGPLGAQQTSLTQDVETDDIDVLADTLINRLSGAAVSKLITYASHIPERAQRRAAYGDAAYGDPVSMRLHSLKPPPRPRRPLLLLPRPEPATAIAEVPDGAPRKLTWRRKVRSIVRSSGPERIAPEWWRGDEAERPRDYYWVEDSDGVRLWVFRHGLLGDEPSANWYVHGLDG
jgi:protein ImuB